MVHKKKQSVKDRLVGLIFHPSGATWMSNVPSAEVNICYICGKKTRKGNLCPKHKNYEFTTL
jgi:hypothetical protein